MIEAASYCVVSSPIQLPTWSTPIIVILLIIGGITAWKKLNG